VDEAFHDTWLLMHPKGSDPAFTLDGEELLRCAGTVITTGCGPP